MDERRSNGREKWSEGRERERAVTGALKGGLAHPHEAAGADEITSLYNMYIYVNQSCRLSSLSHNKPTQWTIP